MQIWMNGKEQDVPPELTVAELVAVKKFNVDTIIIEHNGIILTRDAWATSLLRQGDRVEIVTFVGGG
ncbi:MAG: sulfur carrier protein ThiS [Negativicutes bacterium]|nr:sulfur carrier protein ThiS [Negativicutes bacterium]